MTRSVSKGGDSEVVANLQLSTKLPPSDSANCQFSITRPFTDVLADPAFVTVLIEIGERIDERNNAVPEGRQALLDVVVGDQRWLRMAANWARRPSRSRCPLTARATSARLASARLASAGIAAAGIAAARAGDNGFGSRDGRIDRVEVSSYVAELDLS